VKITIEDVPAGELSLFVRVPGWADGARLAVNDKSVGAEPGSYAELRRVWKTGDMVELTLPMKPRLLEAHPLVEEARNHVAVACGPLVYCLESAELPKGVSVRDAAIPRDATFTVRFDKDLLGGVAVLEGKAEVTDAKQWGDELYRPSRPGDAKKFDINLIPYYAWANRGKSEMTVWLPWGR